MLIEDESLAQELERRRGQKNEVRRIAGLNDRKAALPMNLEEQAELMKKRRGVFQEMRRHPSRLERQRMPIDGDIVDDLELRRKVLGRWTDH